MITRDVQRLLATAGYHKSAIDNDLGPMTRAAVEKVLANRAADLPQTWTDWNPERRAIAAGQLVLRYAGFKADVGVIDGLDGPSTEFALSQWDYREIHGELPPLLRDQAPLTSPWPRQTATELVKFYGPAAGPQCTAGKVELPFRMKLSWALDQTLTRFSCHEKVADSATRVYRKIADAYSPEAITRCGFDLWGGCFANRNVRGGTSLSMHAWGIAIDTDPLRNQLRWDRTRARLADDDCREFWRIWESEGWLSLGRARNYDWMHVQAALL